LKIVIEPYRLFCISQASSVCLKKSRRTRDVPKPGMIFVAALPDNQNRPGGP
jgi:hypothetical protein